MFSPFADFAVFAVFSFFAFFAVFATNVTPTIFNRRGIIQQWFHFGIKIYLGAILIYQK